MRKGLAAWFFSLMGMTFIYALVSRTSESSKLVIALLLIISIIIGIYFYIRDRKDKRGQQWPRRK